jgi:dolichyl-diphosphooligosaccharide--protein glycosyltransferase
MTLLDPTYAKKYIPIIASVSEHQATTWSSFFFDLHYLVFFAPIGLYYCFKKPTPGKIFVGLYVVLAVYFASVMVRLLLVLAPAVSIAGGIGASNLVRKLSKAVKNLVTGRETKKGKKTIPGELALFGLIFLTYISCTYIFHANAAAAEAYSSPSIILCISISFKRLIGKQVYY